MRKFLRNILALFFFVTCFRRERSRPPRDSRRRPRAGDVREIDGALTEGKDEERAVHGGPDPAVESALKTQRRISAAAMKEKKTEPETGINKISNPLKARKSDSDKSRGSSGGRPRFSGEGGVESATAMSFFNSSRAEEFRDGIILDEKWRNE